MYRTFLLSLLAVLVPAMNLRMICVDHGGGTVATSPDADCSEFCPREGPPRDGSSEGCLLVPGGCSSLSAVLAAAPPPSTVALAVPAATFVPGVADANLYVPPSPSRLSPPPRARPRAR